MSKEEMEVELSKRKDKVALQAQRLNELRGTMDHVVDLYAKTHSAIEIFKLERDFARS